MNIGTKWIVLSAALILPVGVAASNKLPATFADACNCTDCGGTDRWLEKTDTAAPPANPPAKTVAGVISWKGPGVTINETGAGSERVSEEQEFYQVTGKVYTVIVEDDGDVHIKLVTSGLASAKKPKKKSKKPVIYIDVEIPPPDIKGDGAYNQRVAGAPWCDLRKTVLGWTDFQGGWTYGKKLTLSQHPTITVTGKRFYDIDHKSNNGGFTTNVRDAKDDQTAVWEIHPVMKLDINP